MKSDKPISAPIGVFDSGFGGLTVLSEIKKTLPEYSFIYLGDNMRAPYGNRSFEAVYEYTLDAVKWLFSQGCQLVILACNTASSKALRSIQQNNLPNLDPSKRVLGVIRPTVEVLGEITKNNHIGILGTSGTIKSKSYEIEIAKLHPNIKVTGEACPMWVPLVENHEYNKEGADYFVKQHLENLLDKDKDIDTILLGCTHYPILIDKIKKYTPEGVSVITQGIYVAKSLKNYLKRHPEIDEKCEKESQMHFYTTDSTEDFDEFASEIFKVKISAERITI